jgi:hypothetical protein
MWRACLPIAPAVSDAHPSPTRQPVPVYRHIYGAARVVMRGAGAVAEAPSTNATKTVYTTRPGLTGLRTTPKQEPTWGAVFLILLTVALFAVSVSLYLVAAVVYAIEAPLRGLIPGVARSNRGRLSGMTR